MKYNSVHRFADLDDARDFVEYIRNASFYFVGCDKDGGGIYTNGKGYTLMICVQP